MGLFTEIILLPLAPVRGVGWLARQLEDEARRRMAADKTFAATLQDLDRRRASGELDADEADAQEEELIQRLLDESEHGGEPDG